MHRYKAYWFKSMSWEITTIGRYGDYIWYRRGIPNLIVQWGNKK